MSTDTVPFGTAATPITEADVTGFAAKLEAWYETLPPGEQAVLQRLLACAEGAVGEECDVEGYAAARLSARLARLFAAGLLGATLAAPLAASAASAAGAVHPASVTQAVTPATQTPEQFIVSKAVALGAAFTGNRVSPSLETVVGGYRIRYQNCDIYYSEKTDAHEVHGAIRDKYTILSNPTLGWGLGLPITDELGTPDGVGRYNEFSGYASIYWTPNTGAMMVRGGIRVAWNNQGRERGEAGYPTSDEHYLHPNQAYSDFQDDVIYWEGSSTMAPDTAALDKTHVEKLLRNLLKANPSQLNYQEIMIQSASIVEVSNTGYDPSHGSRNRLVTLRIQGAHTDRPANFSLDLRLLFYPGADSDGNKTLSVSLFDYSLSTVGDTKQDADYLADLVREHYVFSSPKQLIPQTVPSNLLVLGFKVLPDGGIKLYLQPGQSAHQVAQQIQTELYSLAQ